MLAVSMLEEGAEEERCVSGWSRRCSASVPGENESWIRAGPDGDDLLLTVACAPGDKKKVSKRKFNALVYRKLPAKRNSLKPQLALCGARGYSLLPLYTEGLCAS